MRRWNALSRIERFRDFVHFRDECRIGKGTALTVPQLWLVPDTPAGSFTNANDPKEGISFRAHLTSEPGTTRELGTHLLAVMLN